jgi:CheY-like chemotaxis protein/class 3 adenylate cyclase
VDALDNLEAEGSLSLFDLTSEEISFLDRSMNCCIGFVDMVNSTSNVAEMVSDRRIIGKYYSIFINTMAVLAKNYGAKIVKSAGDALIFYFPDSSDPTNEAAFKDILECFTTMILARDIINAKLHSEGGNLPSVSYRISADYGKVEVATSTSSKGREDLFGSTMNICAKINSMAEPNGIVIGGDLYQIIKSFSSFVNNNNNNGYEFKELRGGYSMGFDIVYTVYRVLSKNNNDISEIAINSVNELFTSKRTSTIKDIQTKQRQPPSQLLQQNQQKQQQKYSANIMVVDDELDILHTYKYILSAEGYNVEAFTDPHDALMHFVQLPDPSSYYQLVLLDIRMPRLNGLQLFYKIKTLSPKIKVMFSSALDVAEEVVSILPDMKYDDIIKKPVEREYFINKINSALNNSTQDHLDDLRV